MTMKSAEARSFEKFHAENPHVYASVVEVCLDLKEQGFDKGSIWLVFNRLRWLYAIKTTGSKFRLSNNHTGYYARVVMAANPELDGFFTLKPLKTPYTPDLEALGLPEPV